jgi:hypothetical protein
VLFLPESKAADVVKRIQELVPAHHHEAVWKALSELGFQTPIDPPAPDDPSLQKRDSLATLGMLSSEWWDEDLKPKLGSVAYDLLRQAVNLDSSNASLLCAYCFVAELGVPTTRLFDKSVAS